MGRNRNTDTDRQRRKRKKVVDKRKENTEMQRVDREACIMLQWVCGLRVVGGRVRRPCPDPTSALETVLERPSIFVVLHSDVFGLIVRIHINLSNTSEFDMIISDNPDMSCSPIQRRFEERLDQRVGEVQASQISASVAADASLHNIQTDMHRLAGRLLDVVQSIQDRLASLPSVGCAVGDRALHKPLEPLHKDSSHDDVQLRSQRKSGQTSGVDVRSGAVVDVHKKSGTKPDARLNTDNITPSLQQSFIFERPGSSKECSLKASPRLGSEQVDPFTGSGVELCRFEGSPDNCEEAGSSSPWRRTDGGDGHAAEFRNERPNAADSSYRQIDFDTRFEQMDKKLERIVSAVGTINRSRSNEGDEDDRKRLKEKLKLAIEVDRRSRIHTIVSRREVWMEYIFGICAPDKRIGKRGSR